MEKLSYQKALKASANMLVYAQDGTETVFPVPKEQLRVGDLLLLEKGNYIPADIKILTGTVVAKDQNGNEQIFESKSIAPKDQLVVEGCAKGYIFSIDEDARI